MLSCPRRTCIETSSAMAQSIIRIEASHGPSSASSLSCRVLRYRSLSATACGYFRVQALVCTVLYVCTARRSQLFSQQEARSWWNLSLNVGSCLPSRDGAREWPDLKSCMYLYIPLPVLTASADNLESIAQIICISRPGQRPVAAGDIPVQVRRHPLVTSPVLHTCR